jgi:nitroimidazol reductase NimA-like FMN-containing flavoprotein (pyridoxamine 5'-phosphate oxidase superfamily)
MEAATLAREILDGNVYATLGTADASGRPWVSPVYYAAEDPFAELLWVSSPSARHSLNIAVRPEVSFVVFDSRTRIGTAAAVYMVGRAAEATGDELARCIEAFSRASVADGAPEWSVGDVSGSATHRLYRAAVDEHWVLDAAGGEGDRRVPVELRG